MKLRIILTGATGMVGEGVLHECLNHPDIEKVLIIGRKPSGTDHPKVEELVHADFFDLSPIREQLKGYDACFFCLGVSSIGMKEPEYERLTYQLTMHMGETLAALNPSMTFCYVSGGSTDSTEKGKVMWARVKGKTENHLLRLFPGKAYMFRPGYMHPTPGLKNTLSFYRYVKWLYPFFRTFMPKYVSTLAELGQAMIHVARKGSTLHVLEVKDIVALASLE